MGPKLASMAWRNLWRNKRRTILTLVSIAFGGSLAVLFTALQDRSFTDFIDTAARLGGGHVTVQHPEYFDSPTLTRTVEDTRRLRELALQDEDARRVVERITGQVMVATAHDSFGAMFMAFDPEAEDDTTLSLMEGLVEGKLFETSRDRGIVLGKTLAKNLGLKLGKKVVYTLTDKDGKIVRGMARLSGVVGLGSPSQDGGLCLLPIDTLREVLGYAGDESTHLAVFLHDSRRSAAVAGRLGSVVGPRAAALTWEESQPDLASFIAMKVGSGRIMEIIIALLVAAGIFNTLFVSVMERLREFGIMLAIGYSPGQLFRLVMWESLWLAFAGVVVGALLTIWPYLHLAETGIDLSAMTGGLTMEVAGVGFDPVIRIGIFPENLVLIIVVVFIATMAAGLYPARRAGRVEPVETIRLV